MDRATFLKAYHHCRLIPNEQDFPATATYTAVETQRNAAVLVVLVERDHGLNVVLTRRAAHLKHHAGQISFPGGKYEITDIDLQHTALRETQEEIGLSLTRSDVVGAIGNYSTISGFSVTPYIAITDDIPPLQIDTNEVEYAFEVPLAHCLAPQNLLSHPVTRFDQTYQVYFIPWENTYIWGATAGILKNLSNHILDNTFTVI